jgi:hypothetical protein
LQSLVVHEHGFSFVRGSRLQPTIYPSVPKSLSYIDPRYHGVTLIEFSDKLMQDIAICGSRCFDIWFWATKSAVAPMRPTLRIPFAGST